MRIRNAVSGALAGSRRHDLPMVGAVLLALGAAQSVEAQQAPASAPRAGELEEIVVTATKRQERLFDVPQSVTVLSGEDLARQWVSITDLIGQVPSLSIQQASPTRNRLILRGQNAGGAGATVATVIDDVPFTKSNALSEGSSTTADFYTYDLDRIEVLRGPQGTLYGANAVGGLIMYVTRAPDPEKFSANAEANVYSMTDGGTGYGLRGYVNVPMGSTAALRLTGFTDQIPGYTDNWVLGKTDVDEGNREGGRASLLWNPTDDLSIRGTVFYNERTADSPSFVNVYGQPDGAGVVPKNRFDLPRGRNFGTFLPQKEEANQFSSYLNVEWDAGPALFTSITAYGNMDNRSGTDASGTLAAPGVNFLDAVLRPIYGETVTANSASHVETDKYSQEFRLTSKNDGVAEAGRFDWLFGLFWTKEDNDYVIPINIRSYATGEILTVPFAGGTSYGPSDYEEYAAFGDVRVYFAPNFDISFGARYTYAEQSVKTSFTSGLFTTGGGPAWSSGENSDSQSKVTWSIAPRWSISDDSMAYARIATGFRPGGPQQLVPGAPPDYPASYDADTSTTYEIGYRTSLLDRRVSVDLAAFYVDWNDIQIVSLFTSSTGQVFAATGNAGKATTQGVEWTLNWTPVDGLLIGLVGSYVDPKLDANAPALGAEKDDRLPYVPKLTNSLTARYDWTVGSDVNLFVSGSWTYFGSFYTDFGVPALAATYVELPSYNTIGLQAGATYGAWSANLYVQNLGDEDALLSYTSTNAPGSPLEPGMPGEFYGYGNALAPRTIGLRIGYSF